MKGAPRVMVTEVEDDEAETRTLVEEERGDEV
jgi:hypothetical protein